ncbi:MAG: hypothetical protein J5842_02980, partial [Lachnospiraceae bacterium]|nr:hypothetical protein [Lachnospiraceae bacterium]
MKEVNGKKIRKKNRKLLFQLGAILIPVILLMLAGAALSILASSVSSYMNSQIFSNTIIIDKVFDLSECSDDTLELYLDFWEEHSEDLKNEEQIEQENISLDYWNDHEYPEIEMKNDYSWLMSLPDDVRANEIKMNYLITDWQMEVESRAFEYDRFFMVDVSKDHMGKVIFDYSETDGEKILGDMFDADLTEDKVVLNMLKFNSDEADSTVARLSPDDGQYFIVLKPVMIKGKIRALLGVGYQWSTISKEMLSTVGDVIKVVFRGMAVLFLILMVVLYFLVIKPILKIEKAVRDYKKDKDSGKAVSKMSKI